MPEQENASMDDKTGYAEVTATLSERFRDHSSGSEFWARWRDRCAELAMEFFGPGTPCKADIPPFGELAFPFRRFGAVATSDLLAVDEMILFSFYARNRRRYKKVVDFGANVGLHSVALARCGFDVRAFEPDPIHVEALSEVLRLNDVRVQIHQAAISTRSGETEFVRVCGNTTGSHIAGSKQNPYGELERFQVHVEAAEPHLRWCDFAKIDIEGHEAGLLIDTPADVWNDTDAMLEVGNEENASRIHDWSKDVGVSLFSQKTGWRKVSKSEDMPTSHREGSVFLSVNNSRPWAEET